MARKAILLDEAEHQITKEAQVPDHAPRELIQHERITGEQQSGVEYIYRLRGINKAGVASYAYHSSRRVVAGFKPSPRQVREVPQ